MEHRSLGLMSGCTAPIRRRFKRCRLCPRLISPAVPDGRVSLLRTEVGREGDVLPLAGQRRCARVESLVKAVTHASDSTEERPLESRSEARGCRRRLSEEPGYARWLARMGSNSWLGSRGGRWLLGSGRQPPAASRRSSTIRHDAVAVTRRPAHVLNGVTEPEIRAWQRNVSRSSWASASTDRA